MNEQDSNVDDREVKKLAHDAKKLEQEGVKK